MSTLGEAAVSQQVQVKPKTQGQLAVQMDELWSFVDDKANKQWVWLAKDVIPLLQNHATVAIADRI